MKMNPWVKKKWIKALRSGEYEQTQEYLATEEGYCCLGVLVEECAPEFIKDGRVDLEAHFIPDDLAILWGLEEGRQDELSTNE